MKTPIQELIDEMTYMLTEGERSIYALREKARKLLEKEKEQIIDAWMDDRFPLDKDWVKQCAEQYYHETFNTKEK